LVLLALLLAALLAGVSYLGLRRMGYLGRPESPEFVFENHLLRTPERTWAILRPMDPSTGETRLLFAKAVPEPEYGPAEAAVREVEFPPLPHFRIGRAHRPNPAETWSYVGAEHALYGLMGAKTSREWLEEIRPVREVGRDGNERVLLRATYGDETGATVVYLYDPADPDPTARGFGWLRREVYGGGALTSVEYAIPDGRLE
jgi:hypothetical protein